MNADRETSRMGTSNGSDIRAALACDRCRRRKIKCDRALPACRTCLETTRSCCSYPVVSQKPGPKPGAPQRRRLRGLNGAVAFNHSSPADLYKDSNSTSNSSFSQANPGPFMFPGQSHLWSPSGKSQDQSARSEEMLIGQDAQQSFPTSLPSPLTTASVAAESERSTSRGLTLSQIIHPSHEPLQHTTCQVDEIDGSDGRPRVGMRSNVCEFFGISMETYTFLLNAYFENMTAFSLFHRPNLDAKLSAISSPVQRHALLASIFSFSARFKDIGRPQNAPQVNIPSQEYFHSLAGRLIDEALRECPDNSPPLCLLQALILNTFQQLINGVRGRAWRSVGTCVRIAYDLQLHLIDRNLQGSTSESPINSNFRLDEERRRAWWTVWEFDVFASTVRRLPTAIDWASNVTWLPVDDEYWFSNSFKKSCHLSPDAALAWKTLEKSRNTSPKAWFIVVNALMRSAHVLSYPQAYPNTNHPRSQQSTRDPIPTVQPSLDVLANSLYCLSAALPSSLTYQGEFLSFSHSGSRTRNSLHEDSAKHSIYIMIQLSRFMIHYYQVFNNTSRHSGIATSSSDPYQNIPAISSLDSIDQAAWNTYLSAASEVITIVRNSSPKHVYYVNPFLASTIWLFAAAQVVSCHFGPALVNRRAAESNLDLLRMNLNAYVSFWEVSSTLQQKLNTLEARLENIRGHSSVAGAQAVMEGRTSRTPTTAFAGQLGDLTSTRGSLHDAASTTQDTTSVEQAEASLGIRNQAIEGDVWPAPGNFLDVESGMVANMPSNLWGWGINELLSYSGSEWVPDS